MGEIKNVGFTLDLDINDDHDIKVSVSGYTDVRNAVAGLVRVFSDPTYIQGLWDGLVERDG
jgi:hypothetical protein